jgi:hypothetical protein
MKDANITIVTACDNNYLWGVYLLTASIHRNALPVNTLFFSVGFDAETERFITQFPEVVVKKADTSDPFPLNNRKAEAMLLAESEYVAWFDADCLVYDWIGDDLLPLNGELQVRMRGRAENASVFERYYAPGEEKGGIPASVLDRWREDVGGRTTPAYDSTCPSNVIVIHRRFMPFIEEWDRLTRKVVDPKAKGAVNRADPAYWMTDESALNAVLLFSLQAPKPSPYRLDNLNAGHVVHFMGSPKPWKGWLPRFLYCLPKVVELLDWLDAQGFKIPPVPPSFNKKRIARSRMEAHLRGGAGAPPPRGGGEGGGGF